MTYQEYKDELSCLKHLMRDLNAARMAVWDSMTAVQRDGFMELEVFNTLNTFDYYVVTRYMAHNDRIRKDEAKVRSYRSALAHWFWTSRLGVPPALH